jgi:GNAT superfamily N-acetyltransferase
MAAAWRYPLAMPPAINIVRAATRDDAAIAVTTLARAFDADPPLNWFVRRDAERAAAIRRFFEITFERLTFPFGCVEISEDLSGVALWTPPGRWKLNPLRELLLLPHFWPVLGKARLRDAWSATRALAGAHPKEPHYYLFALGVDPPRQGHGIGAALLRSRLDRCDAEGAGAYLEASTEGSRRLYERWGFVARAPLRLGRDAPPVWPMWRAPRAPERRMAPPRRAAPPAD